MTTLAKEIKHPYIIFDRRIRGGTPVISGTGIRVIDIAVRYEFLEMTPDDILLAFPHLNLSQIHDALSYYYDHKDEIDTKWKAEISETESKRKAQTTILEKKLGKIKDLHR